MSKSHVPGSAGVNITKKALKDLIALDEDTIQNKMLIYDLMMALKKVEKFSK